MARRILRYVEHKIFCLLSLVDCQYLKWTGAKSAGRFASCCDFILTAYMPSMKWKDLAHYKPELGMRDGGHGGEARIWEEDGNMLSPD
jgi:hypothetical protein